MKTAAKLFFLSILIIKSPIIFSQTLAGYFETKGVYNLCQAAHVSHDYLSGTYDIKKGYIDVSIKSRDAFGSTKQTDIRVMRGTGDLFFSQLVVTYDNATWLADTFEAFGFQASLMLALIEAVDQRTYDKMRNAVKETFNTDFENWTGKMWALLAINLDYYEYMLTGR
jgi:hypothetical protein